MRVTQISRRNSQWEEEYLTLPPFFFRPTVRDLIFEVLGAYSSSLFLLEPGSDIATRSTGHNTREKEVDRLCFRRSTECQRFFRSLSLLFKKRLPTELNRSPLRFHKQQPLSQVTCFRLRLDSLLFEHCSKVFRAFVATKRRNRVAGSSPPSSALRLSLRLLHVTPRRKSIRCTNVRRHGERCHGEPTI